MASWHNFVFLSCTTLYSPFLQLPAALAVLHVAFLEVLLMTQSPNEEKRISPAVTGQVNNRAQDH